jgi:hypothetical protein
METSARKETQLLEIRKYEQGSEDDETSSPDLSEALSSGQLTLATKSWELDLQEKVSTQVSDLNSKNEKMSADDLEDSTSEISYKDVPDSERLWYDQLVELNDLKSLEELF